MGCGYEICRNSDEADFAIVNTCAVTAESERKSRQAVRRVARSTKTLVIGCASQISGFDGIENVVFVGGCRDKSAVVEYINNFSEKSQSVDTRRSMDGAVYEQMSISGTSGLFSDCRAFVKIQDGCNGKCTYCIIPKCRGKVRSRPFGEVVAEVNRLVAHGYKEVILTGIETAAYNSARLSQVIREMSGIEGLHRVRLGSLTPNAINNDFVDAVMESVNFMPHLHLSLQSCCDKTLRRMQRPYTKKDILDRVDFLKKRLPGINLSADIIVGFPGETESDFLETLDTLRDIGIFHVHSFPYSERKGTPAAEMDGSVPVSVRHERNSRLIRMMEQHLHKILDGIVGAERTVLVEKIHRDGNATGHTEDFFEVKTKAPGCNVGDMLLVDIISIENNLLVGKPKNTEEGS